MINSNKLTPKQIASYFLIFFVVFAPFITSIIHKPNRLGVNSQTVVFQSLREHAISSSSAEKKPTNDKIAAKEEIPKYIHQYVESKENIPEDVQKCINSWKQKNSTWKQKLYNKDDVETFMKVHHSDVYSLWTSLKTVEEKINMWKYAVLDTIGGVYADADTYCLKPIEEWSSIHDLKNSLAIVGLSRISIPKTKTVNKKLTDSIEFSTSVIAAVPNHEILHNMPYYINRYIKLEELKVNRYLDDPKTQIYFRTGQGIWTESLFNYLIEHGINFEDLENKKSSIIEEGELVILGTDAFAYSIKDTNNDRLPEDILVYTHTNDIDIEDINNLENNKEKKTNKRKNNKKKNYII